MLTKKHLFLGMLFFCLTQNSAQFSFAQEAGLSTPEQVTLHFLQAVKDQNYRAAYKVLSFKDQDAIDLKQFSAEAEERYSFLIMFAEQAEISVQKKSSTVNKAVVTARITAPDEAKALTRTVLDALDEDRQEEISDLLGETDKPLPKRTRKQNYDLRREQEGWKVYLGWARDKRTDVLLEQAEKNEQTGQMYEALEFYRRSYAISPDEEILSKIQFLEKKQADDDLERRGGYAILGEARQLEKTGKYLASEQKYRLVLEKDPELLQAKLGIERLQEKKDKAALQLLLQDIEVKNVVSRGMSITGKIKNTGVLALGQVRLRADFLDENGQVIYAQKIFPVWKSAWAFGEKKKPLRSKQTRSFVVSARKAPPSWNKTVNVVLEGVEFAE